MNYLYHIAFLAKKPISPSSRLEFYTDDSEDFKGLREAREEFSIYNRQGLGGTMEKLLQKDENGKSKSVQVFSYYPGFMDDSGFIKYLGTEYYIKKFEDYYAYDPKTSSIMFFPDYEDLAKAIDKAGEIETWLDSKDIVVSYEL